MGRSSFQNLHENALTGGNRDQQPGCKCFKKFLAGSMACVVKVYFTARIVFFRNKVAQSMLPCYLHVAEGACLLQDAKRSPDIACHSLLCGTRVSTPEFAERTTVMGCLEKRTLDDDAVGSPSQSMRTFCQEDIITEVKIVATISGTQVR